MSELNRNKHQSGGVQSSEEAELLERVARGDAGALTELYDRYAAAVYSLARRMIRDSQEAEGVTQQVFLTVWKKAAHYEAKKGRLSTWLFAITRNRAIDILRKGRRGVSEIEAIEPTRILDRSQTRNPLSEYLQTERRELVLRALQEIPEEQRVALYLAYYDGLSHREIARALDQPLGTIKTRIQLGMDKLRQALRPYFSA